jgi:hypothetical protein
MGILLQDKILIFTTSRTRISLAWFLITSGIMRNVMQLLQAATSNTTTAVHENYSYLQTVFCWGTFNGATVTLQGSPEGTEWFDITSFTAKGVIGIGLSVRFLRAVITSAGASTSVTLLVE